MNQDPVKISRVNWLQVLPGLHLCHALSLGLRLRTLIPALLVLLLLGAVSGLFLTANTPEGHSQMDMGSAHVNRLQLQLWHETPLQPDTDDFYPSLSIGDFYRAFVPLPVALGISSFEAILFATGGLLDHILMLTSLAVVLTFAGTAISRAVAMQFCRGTRSGAVASVRFAISNFRKVLLSTVLAGLLISLPILLLSAVSGFANSFLPLWSVQAVWPAILLLALIAMLTSVVVGVGWLLSLAAVATDQCTGSDALSRGINYVLSHKFRTSVYLLFVTAVAGIARLITEYLLETSGQILAPRLSQMAGITGAASTQNIESTGVGQWWQSVSVMLPHAAQLAVFFAGLLLTYVLLRQAEDAVQLRETEGGRKS